MEAHSPPSTTMARVKKRPDSSPSGEIACPCAFGKTAGTVTPILTAGPCSSSMDLAWDLVERGLFPEWTSLLVECQWAGRGQHRRSWHSPVGNIYASLCLPAFLPPWRTLRSLVVGNMAAEFLEKLGLEIELKWPNDLLIQGKKIGGILIEKKGTTAVAGVGLNLGSAPRLDDLGLSHSVPASCLNDQGIDMSPRALWTTLIKEGVPSMRSIITKASPDEFIARLERRLAFAGEKVVVFNGYETNYPAIITGIDPSGGLRIKTGEGPRIIYSGSIFPATL